MSTFLPIDEWGDITTLDGLNHAVDAFVGAHRTLTDPRHALAANADGLTIPPFVRADWVVPPINPQDSYRIIDLRDGTTFMRVPLCRAKTRHTCADLEFRSPRAIMT